MTPSQIYFKSDSRVTLRESLIDCECNLKNKQSIFNFLRENEKEFQVLLLMNSLQEAIRMFTHNSRGNLSVLKIIS